MKEFSMYFIILAISSSQGHFYRLHHMNFGNHAHSSPFQNAQQRRPESNPTTAHDNTTEHTDNFSIQLHEFTGIRPDESQYPLTPFDQAPTACLPPEHFNKHLYCNNHAPKIITAMALIRIENLLPD